jgi:hypothetical protein
MCERSRKSRRDFFKASAGGAAGVWVASRAGTAKAQASGSPWPATGYMQINPDIDNCRVAYITDTSMLTRTTYNNFTDANTNAIDHAKVKANLDKVACALARKASPADAWATIFRKPTAKSWSQVKVAIKVNACGYYKPSVAAVAKFCEALNALGVPYPNITVFDGGAASGSACPNEYPPFQTSGKLPAGVVFISRGDTYPVSIDGWATNSVTVVRDADIFIDAAVNKGHDRKAQFSGVTMTLKNHVGTINFSHPGDDPGVYKLCAYHKHEAILGMPTADIPPKQQLCFVDSLWAARPGDWVGGVDSGAQLQTLVMGTLAGVVDYFTTNKVRIRKYNDWNVTRVNEFVEGFGYTAAERAALDTMDPNADSKGRGFVDAATYTAGTSRGDVDRKIRDHKSGSATSDAVKGVIGKYRQGQ